MNRRLLSHGLPTMDDRVRPTMREQSRPKQADVDDSEVAMLAALFRIVRATGMQDAVIETLRRDAEAAGDEWRARPNHLSAALLDLLVKRPTSGER